MVYYLNGKQVAEFTEPPYTYKPDVSKLADGTYQLKMETFYADGTRASSTTDLKVGRATDNKTSQLIGLASIGGAGLAVIVIAIFLVKRVRNAPSGPKAAKQSYSSRSSGYDDDGSGFVEIDAGTITSASPNSRPRRYTRPGDWWR